ncbi:MULTISPECIES: ribonuclease J [Bartonella]|uniref:ribonuclease J n=1 Tax=Bartonella TaxID=773 RepID=UPI00098EE55A|nr:MULTISPECIES: ribonuclease J [Bartonella]AQT44887.1 ribonuclease J [Bartonella apihabitans]MBH9994424.1 ribonuclease J [Bartonella sp. P0291]MBH9997231.1 ribonuclease J [Bartonella sp. M0192]MBH9999391.1 ribonuclease J [Bartonella sp. M0191]MBI0007127.1 ribonuclease J [Bartonella sp. M0193]
MASGKNNELVFLPLGGVGEIGMNLGVYGFGPEGNRQWLMVDLGVSFAGPELPGVDLVMPDIRFLENERPNILGLVVTHAHEDHFGAILDLWPKLKIPVYCTAFTAGLLETKRELDYSSYDVPVTLFKAGDQFELGPFAIEAIAVAHSIPEPVSLAIKTSLGTVIHTGDWKIDNEPSLGAPTDEKRFSELGDEGVLALVCDSTNSMREGVSPTEHDVLKSLTEIIANERGRVAITTFSSNVGRIISIARAAKEAGRQVLLVGRSIKRSVTVAEELGYLEGIDPFLNEEDYPYIPRDKIVMVLTGSQGEQRAALAKLSRDEMRSLALTAGDTVIYSSRSIPGNERSIIDTQNRLIDMGVKIITDHDALVHVSGHPRRSDLKKMYEWVRPKILVPVHGEALHLAAQTVLGRQAGIKTVAEIRNGDMLKLAPEPAEIIDEVPVGQIYKDGNLIGNEDEMGISERRKLSYVGHVAVSFLLDKHYNLVEMPEVVTFGLPETDDEGELFDDIISNTIETTIDSIPRARRKDDEVIHEAVRRSIRATINEKWGKKPVCTVFIHHSK